MNSRLRGAHMARGPVKDSREETLQAASRHGIPAEAKLEAGAAGRNRMATIADNPASPSRPAT